VEAKLPAKKHTQRVLLYVAVGVEVKKIVN
jgi:hypothetical protein